MKSFWLLIFPFFAFCSELEDQTKLFKTRDFVWVKGFFSKDEVKLLKTWADRAQKDGQEALFLSHTLARPLSEQIKMFADKPIVVPERNDELQVCRVEDLMSSYPDLGHFIEETLLDYLGRLTGEPYVAFKDKLNFKWPGGGAFPYHQDYPAFEVFGPREHISVMVCIDPATIENGCLQVASNWRETFKGELGIDQDLLAEGKVVLEYIEGGPMHGTIVSELTDQIDWIPVTADAGDVVFFTSYVPHYSEPNRSDSSRRALILTFNRLVDGEHKAFYYETKRNDPENPMFHFGTPTNARNK